MLDTVLSLVGINLKRQVRQLAFTAIFALAGALLIVLALAFAIAALCAWLQLEFGTLPGVHNFLREWSDEYSFSSWAVAWGAEEARHSLVLTRYLKLLGIETLEAM